MNNYQQKSRWKHFIVKSNSQMFPIILEGKRLLYPKSCEVELAHVLKNREFHKITPVDFFGREPELESNGSD